MKNIFSCLLFFLLFSIIVPNKQKQKLIEKETEILDTDSVIVELSDFYENEEVETALPVEEYQDIGPDAPESATATAQDAQVDINKPVSTIPKNKDMKNAQIHLMKIHNFNIQTSEKISFNALFYFFGIPLARNMLLRLRVNIPLAEIAYSARTDCSITNHYKNLFENELNGIQGEYINYKCQANRIFYTDNLEVILNTDVPIILYNSNKDIQVIDFYEINFNGDAVDETSNIQKNIINLEKYGTLENTELFINNRNLIFKGEINPPRTLEKVKKIKMLLMTQENVEINTKNYSCNIILISEPTYELDCNISETYFNTTVNNLHLSTGTSEEGVFLTIDLKYGLNNETEIIIDPVEINQINYRKSSDGLSGGAIAGIVVAGVAVIATISVITIVLIKRKTKLPIDAGTNGETKTEINKIEPSKIEPSKIDPNKIEPSKIEPSKIEPGKIEPEKIDPKIEYGSKK